MAIQVTEEKKNAVSSLWETCPDRSAWFRKKVLSLDTINTKWFDVSTTIQEDVV